GRCSPATSSSTRCGTRRPSGRARGPSPSTSAASAAGSRSTPTTPGGSPPCGGSATASPRRPAPLHLVHGLVRPADEHLRLVGHAPPHGHADAGPDHFRPAAEEQGPGHGLLHAGPQVGGGLLALDA